MNSDKCHLLMTGHKYKHIWIKIDLILESNSVKLRGITTGNLKLGNDSSLLCANANSKLSAFARITYYS